MAGCLIFNILDWYEVDDGENGIYTIKLFGRTKDDKSVYLRVEGFKPHFYVEKPETWTKQDMDKIVFSLSQRRKQTSFEKYEPIEKRNFLGFRAGKMSTFYRFLFRNKREMGDWARVLENGVSKLGEKKPYKFQIFESNLDPMLRMMHLRNIKPCGWISIQKSQMEEIDDETSTCELNYACAWTSIERVQDESLARFKILSYDLECQSSDKISFPQPQRIGDKITFVGMSFSRYGTEEPYRKVIVVLGTCNPIDGCDVVECRSEAELLNKYVQITQEEDPDVRCGYNICGFDESYIWERCNLLGIKYNTGKQGKLIDDPCPYVEKKLSSAGLGDNLLKYYATPGRVMIDLLKVVQRDYKLNSYKLDSVAEEFFKGDMTNIEVKSKELSAKVKDVYMLRVGNYVRFEKNKESLLPKHRISRIDGDVVTFSLSAPLETGTHDKLKWCMVKDDLKPQAMFELFEKGPEERKIIGQYCIQDCVLVSRLMHKLHIITRNVCLANVSYVPLSYIFLRGQGIKCYSLVARTAYQHKYCIPVLRSANSDEEEETYEGATVFEPDIGFHHDPIPVLDYNSLYPSSIIERNISHEMIVLDPQYDNLPGYDYVDIPIRGKETETVKDPETGKETKVDKWVITNTHRYAIPKDGSRGVVPVLLQDLLSERKRVKKLMEAEEDPFLEMIYDGLQLALKVTANSVYGQLGSSVGPLGYKPLAASTTATGRERLESARDFVEKDLRGICQAVYNAAKKGDESALNALYDEYLANKAVAGKVTDYVMDVFSCHDIVPKVIYGDTDSIFCNMGVIKKEDGEPETDRKVLDLAIKVGNLASWFIKKRLPFPHNLEYEKTFYPLLLVRKKGYYGNKYENDPKKYTVVSMGIVLKRRDNAPIVKKIIGQLLDIMVNEINVQKAINFLQQSLRDLLDGKYPIEDFVTSKTLKASYKDASKADGEIVYKVENKNGTEVRYRSDGFEIKYDDLSLVDDMVTREIEGLKRPLKSGGFKLVGATKASDVYAWDDPNLSGKLAHVALAKRMKDRDPGNAPQVNDRIPFVFIEMKQERGKKILQSDKVEHPEYIAEHDLKIDYLHYLTNQIMIPASQFLDLVMDKTEVDALFSDIVDPIKKARKDEMMAPVLAAKAQEKAKKDAEKALKAEEKKAEKERKAAEKKAEKAKKGSLVLDKEKKPRPSRKKKETMVDVPSESTVPTETTATPPSLPSICETEPMLLKQDVKPRKSLKNTKKTSEVKVE